MLLNQRADTRGGVCERFGQLAMYTHVGPKHQALNPKQSVSTTRPEPCLHMSSPGTLTFDPACPRVCASVCHSVAASRSAIPTQACRLHGQTSELKSDRRVVFVTQLASTAM